MPTPIVLEEGSGYWFYEDDTYMLWGEDPVTFTLFDITYQVVRELGVVDEGIATGGSTTTIADTNARTEDDDYWNTGTAWILRDYLGAGAAPEGEYSVISDFANSGGVVTLRDTLTVAVSSGDRYAVAGKQVPLDIIIQKVNQAFIDLGAVPYTDTTSITIAADKTEYTLPIAANLDLRQVWLQMDDSDADDNLWTELINWVVEQSDPGVADELILPYQYSSGYALKIVYMAIHPSLYISSSVLSEHVPLERVVYPAVLDCLRWRKQRTRQSTFDDDIERYEAKVDTVRQTHPIRVPVKLGRVLTLGSATVSYDDEPNKVYL